MPDLISEGPVLMSVEDGVARLTLNRPKQSNGLSIELLEALHRAVLACSSERDVRVVLLSGAGPHFCAGGDVKEFASKGTGLPDFLRRATALLQIATAGLVHQRVQ